MEIRIGFTKGILKSFEQKYSENYQGISYNLHTVCFVPHLSSLRKQQRLYRSF